MESYKKQHASILKEVIFLEEIPAVLTDLSQRYVGGKNVLVLEKQEKIT